MTRLPLVVLMGGLLLVALLLMLGAQDAVATHTCQPSDPDSDGDKLPYSCDPAPSNPDWDGDGFEDSLEIWVTTDPGNGCSFPADTDNSGTISAGDPFILFAYWLWTPDDPGWVRRYDIDGSQQISAGDVFVTFANWLETCATPWYYPGTITVELHPETADSTLAFHWYTDHAEIYSAELGIYKTGYCSEFENAASHWTNNTDFDFSVSYDAQGECDGPGNVAFQLISGNPDIVAVTALWTIDRQCERSNPCFYAYFAVIGLNEDHPSNNSVSYRHMVFTHEFGHVVTHDDINGCDSPVWSIMVGGATCLWNAGLHWPTANDALFTDMKY